MLKNFGTGLKMDQELGTALLRMVQELGTVLPRTVQELGTSVK